MCVVDGAAHTQKDDVESNGGSLENVAKVFFLFHCGVNLVNFESTNYSQFASVIK